MTIHKCVYCNYDTIRDCNFKRHLNSKKHLNNIKDINKNKLVNNISDTAIINFVNFVNNKFDKMENKLENKIENKMDKLENKIDKMETKMGVMEHKIIKEQRKTNKNILTLLMNDYQNNPPLLQINKTDFNKQLELEYNEKINDDSCKLQIKMIKDYKNKKLIDVIIKLILIFIKNNNVSLQSVFNTDMARANYATKINQSWYNDKLGIKLKNIILLPIVQYLSDTLVFLNRKIMKEHNLNLKSASYERVEFIATYSDALLDIKCYIENDNTHNEIIYKLAPHLRFDKEYLSVEM